MNRPVLSSLIAVATENAYWEGAEDTSTFVVECIAEMGEDRDSEGRKDPQVKASREKNQTREYDCDVDISMGSARHPYFRWPSFQIYTFKVMFLSHAQFDAQFDLSKFETIAPARHRRPRMRRSRSLVFAN